MLDNFNDRSIVERELGDLECVMISLEVIDRQACVFSEKGISNRQ